MKKKFLPILTFLSAGLLVGCGTTVVDPGVNRTVVVDPDDIKLSAYSMNMFADETVAIKAIIAPAKAYNSVLKWSSSNASVAKVNAKGEVTGVSKGTAVITAKYENGEVEVSASCTVRVTAKMKKGKDLYGTLDEVAEAQKTKYPNGLDKVHAVEVRYDDVYKNGVLQTSMIEYSDFLMGIKDGYFNISGRDIETRCEDGSTIVTDYQWIFINDSDFMTHLYHVGNNQKNRLDVAAQSYLGKARIEPVYAVLDSIFSSGRKIMTNMYGNATGADRLDYTQLKSAIDYGWSNDDAVGYMLSSSYGDEWDYDYERYWDIPYIETEIEISFSESNTWEDAVVKTSYITQTMTYEFEGDIYSEVLTINYTFEVNDDVELIMPNNAEYTQVDDLFDL